MNRTRRRTFRAFWAGSLFCLALMVALLFFCINTMRSIPYTGFALVLTSPLFKFMLLALRQQWRQKVVFDADGATCTNAPTNLVYESVQAARFSYFASMHMSYKSIVLELKQTSSLAPAGRIVWELNDFSLSAVAHILIELCQRTSISTVQIQTPMRREVEPDLQRPLVRHGSITLDKSSGSFVFTLANE